MVVPVVIVAVAAGGVAAATGVYFLIRRLWGGKNDESQFILPQAFPLEELPKYASGTRPLGQMEFIMMNLHEMDKGVLSVALVLEMKSEVSDGVVKQALGALAKVHPLLRVKIVKNKNVPSFVPIADMQVSFESSSNAVWEDVLAQEIEKKFDVSTGPLWRAVFLPNAITTDVDKNPDSEKKYPVDNVLILSFHRSVVDEGFIAELSAQFLRILNHEMGDDKSEIPPHDILLPALDVNFTQKDVTPAWYDAMAKRIRKITEKRIENIGEINENQPKATEVTLEKKEITNLPQEVTHAKLSQDLTLKFFNKCAEYEVAISAALEVATVLAYAHDESKKKDEVMPMQIEQSVFLKPMLPAIPLEYCGNYSVENVIDTAVPQASKFFESYWNLAMSVTEGLATTMQTAMPIVDAGLPPDTPTETEKKVALEDKVEAAPDAEPGTPTPPPDFQFKSLRVSTLGACGEGENTKNPHVRIKGLFGHVGLRIDGPDLGHCHTAVNEQLCWTLSYKQGKITKQEAEDLVKKTVKYIAKSLDQKPIFTQKVQGVPIDDQNV